MTRGQIRAQTTPPGDTWHPTRDPTTESLGQSSTVETQGSGPKYKLMKIVDALKEKMSKFFKETQENTNRCRR